MEQRTKHATRTTPIRAQEEPVPYDTLNDLPKSARGELAGLLNQRLADAVDLQSQVKQAHWNVKGPHFIGLHKLFDKISEDVGEYVDLLAERIVQLGGVAKGTVRVAAEHSRLEEYPLDIAEGSLHILALSKSLSAFGRDMRLAISETDELGDADTADLCTGISRGVDKWLWMVEAHVQAKE